MSGQGDTSRGHSTVPSSHWGPPGAQGSAGSFPAPHFPRAWGSRHRQDHPPGPGMDPVPQHLLSRQHQTGYNPALIRTTASSTQ